MRMRFAESSSWAERMTRSFMASLRCLYGSGLRFRAEIRMDCGGRIATIADSPYDQRCAARDVAACEHAVDIRHQRFLIGLERTPSRYGEIWRAELRGQIFGIETQC